MISTTLNKIRAAHPCKDGWKKLLRRLGKTRADDEPLPLSVILDSNGLNDCLWALRCVEGHDREFRLYAVRCARRVQYLLTDPRSLAALDVAEHFARGTATRKELAAAGEAAQAAAWTAEWAARAAAGAAALAAAWAEQAAAEAAVWTAEWAAGAAARAARATAWAEQEADFRRMLDTN